MDLVAFGLVIGTHPTSDEDFLRLIASEHSVVKKETGLTTYKIKLYDDINMLDNPASEFEATEFDICNDHLGLSYAQNRNILIGCPHGAGAIMIYLDYIRSGYSPVEIDEEDLNDLIRWKRELIEQGRLDNVSLQMVGDAYT